MWLTSQRVAAALITTATVGVGAAQVRFLTLMPAAGHVVQPSHIYQLIGRYVEAIRSSELVVRADEDYITMPSARAVPDVPPRPIRGVGFRSSIPRRNSARFGTVEDRLHHPACRQDLNKGRRMMEEVAGVFPSRSPKISLSPRCSGSAGSDDKRSSRNFLLVRRISDSRSTAARTCGRHPAARRPSGSQSPRRVGTSIRACPQRAVPPSAWSAIVRCRT
jgi:hypothetical protein